jgi:hypothetical protein
LLGFGFARIASFVGFFLILDEGLLQLKLFFHRALMNFFLTFGTPTNLYRSQIHITERLTSIPMQFFHRGLLSFLCSFHEIFGAGPQLMFDEFGEFLFHFAVLLHNHTGIQVEHHFRVTCHLHIADFVARFGAYQPVKTVWKLVKGVTPVAFFEHTYRFLRNIPLIELVEKRFNSFELLSRSQGASDRVLLIRTHIAVDS